jgi:hypothetical protein
VLELALRCLYLESRFYFKFDLCLLLFVFSGPGPRLQTGVPQVNVVTLLVGNWALTPLTERLEVSDELFGAVWTDQNVEMVMSTSAGSGVSAAKKVVHVMLEKYCVVICKIVELVLVLIV